MPANLENSAVATGLKKFSFHSSPKESDVALSCPTLRDPLYCSPPGSSIHGIFKARVLEWVAIAFSSPKERQCQIMLKLPHNCTHLTCGKASACLRETRVQSLGWEDLLEKETATHSSILAWKILWTEESGRLQSMGSQRVGHD